MSLYLIALLTHVLVAILGLGSVVCIALIAAAARRAGRNAAEAAAGLRPLLRLSAFSLAIMLISGMVMVSSAGGGFHGAWWVRLSVHAARRDGGAARAGAPRASDGARQ